MSESKVFAFSRPVGTSRKRVSTVATAVEILDGCGFGHGVEVDVITGGQFSLIDLIDAVLRVTGPARVDLATWTAAEFDLTQVTAQLTSGMIERLRLVVDRSFVSRAPDFVQAVAERFGAENIRTTRTHAKFAVIENSDWKVTIRTSMNLNHNARTEWAQVAEDADLAAFYRSYIDEIFATTDPGLVNKRDVNALVGIEDAPRREAFTVGELSGIGGQIV